MHQVAKRRIDFALPGDAVQAGEGGALDDQGEMAFAARIVAGMPDMLVALVFQVQPSGRQGGGQPVDHLACNGSGGSFGHHSYIEAFEESDTSGDAAIKMAWAGGRSGNALLRARLRGGGRVSCRADAVGLGRTGPLAVAVPRPCPRT